LLCSVWYCNNNYFLKYIKIIKINNLFSVWFLLQNWSKLVLKCSSWQEKWYQDVFWVLYCLKKLIKVEGRFLFAVWFCIFKSFLDRSVFRWNELKTRPLGKKTSLSWFSNHFYGDRILGLQMTHCLLNLKQKLNV
jgi:hypothetical protein